MIGQTLSHYQVREEISRGGMGIVYRALDVKLGREVALKVLPPELVADPERRRRFEQEARAAAALEHPHIAVIHEIGDAEGVTFIAMELITGEELREALAQRRLPAARALDLALEVAEGLAKAHDRGIVHRDLKPANIMLTEDGHAKIIDFGLAKLTEPVSAGGSEMETLLRKETEPGIVMGTVSYMSPEQARGAKVDSRSDIFSFGVVLHEMLNGRPPFQGPSGVESLNAILTSPAPPLTSLGAEVSPEATAEVQRLVDKCLAKDREERYQTIKDTVVDLRAARRRVESGALLAKAPSRRKTWLPAGAAALVAGLLAAVAAVVLIASVIAWLRVRPPPSPSGPVSIAVLPLAYDGPQDKAYLAPLVPLVLSQDLAGASGLEVVPFASSRSFGAEEAARSVARQLGVRSVVQGRIDVREQTFQVSLKLFGEEGSRELWSSKLEGDVGRLLPALDPVAVEIAAALGARLAPAPVGSPEAQARALEHYLEGKRRLEGWDIERNYVHAVAAFERAIEAQESFAEAHAGLALALWTRYEDTGEPALVERALAEARRALTLAPSLPEAHLAMGVVELGTGHSAEAASSFQKAQALAPADDAVCRRIADAYAALGRADEAEKMYQKAVDLRPAFWESSNRKGLFHLHRGQLAEAMELFRQVIRLRPESDAGYTNLASGHILAGEFREAEPLLQAALRIQPVAEGYNNLGFVYYAEGRFEEAAREFQQAIQAGAQQAMPWGNLGDAYRQLGRLEEARDAYARAIEFGETRLKINPADSESRGFLAMSLAGSGRCREARGEAGRAVRDSLQNPTLDYYAAVAYSICGDRASALRHTARAIEGGVLADVRTSPDLKPLLADAAIQKLLR